MNADKKKVMIIGLLAVCLIGVGVFQFVASSGSSTEASPDAKSSKSGDVPSATEGAGLFAQNSEAADPVRDLYKWPLTQRDPFAKNMAALAPLSQGQPQQQKTPPPSDPAPRRATTRPPIEPFNLEGLPFVNNGGGVQLENGQPLRQPGELTYSLSGVILGSKPAAVFTDDAGNQRLVQAGGKLDGDCEVVSVSQNQVVLKHHGKTKTLTLGGNPNAQ